MPADTPAPDATPRRRFIALLDQLDGWLQAEKEKGSDAIAANPALVKSLRNPIPPAPAPGAPRPAPAAPLILFIAGPAGTEDGELLLTRMIAALGLKESESLLVRTGEAGSAPLAERMAALRPKLVVTMDEAAWREAAGPDAEPLESVRGTWQPVAGVEVMPTYGPAYLLARPADKKTAWKDLQAVLARLGRKPPPVNK